MSVYRVGPGLVIFLLTAGGIVGFFVGVAVGLRRTDEIIHAWKRETAACIVELEKQREFLRPVFGKPVRLE